MNGFRWDPMARRVQRRQRDRLVRRLEEQRLAQHRAPVLGVGVESWEIGFWVVESADDADLAPFVVAVDEAPGLFRNRWTGEPVQTSSLTSSEQANLVEAICRMGREAKFSVTPIDADPPPAPRPPVE